MKCSCGELEFGLSDLLWDVVIHLVCVCELQLITLSDHSHTMGTKKEKKKASSQAIQ